MSLSDDLGQGYPAGPAWRHGKAGAGGGMVRFCLFLFSVPFIAPVLSPTALVKQVTAPPGTPGGMKTQN